MTPLLVIVGPTGAGKSDLALSLAKRYGAEIVSADSQQVYRGMDIGTGKVASTERAAVPHHGIDVVEPHDEMSAARFATIADGAISAAWGRGRPVIVCGGTGLYVRALLLGFFEGAPADPTIRALLQDELAAKGADALYAQLALVDPDMAARVHCNDHKRVLRALEVYRATGQPMSAHLAAHDHRAVPPRYSAHVVGLAQPREELYARIERRVDDMLRSGWLAEVAELRARGVAATMRSQDALGYRELHHVLDGSLALNQAIAIIKQRSRNYARRQLTWFRADASTHWFQRADAVDVSSWERYLSLRG